MSERRLTQTWWLALLLSCIATLMAIVTFIREPDASNVGLVVFGIAFTGVSLHNVIGRAGVGRPLPWWFIGLAIPVAAVFLLDSVIARIAVAFVSAGLAIALICVSIRQQRRNVDRP